MPSRPWLSRYDSGVPFHLDYPPVPVFHFLDDTARLCPERTCIIFKGETHTYREVALQTDRLAAALLDLGLRKGERVGICMPNCPEFVLAYFAILKAGAVVVAINPLYTPPEIIHQVNDAGVRMVFCAGSLYERLKTAQPETGICRVIVTGIGTPQPEDLILNDLLNTTSYPQGMNTKEKKENVVSFVPFVFNSATGPEDIALFQYTGGTTGIPKAAVASHRNLVANTLQFKALMSTLEEEE